MSQEFVTELNDEEVKLNEEINVLLNGIDFQQSLSQEKSPTTIPSTFPEENGFTSEQHVNISRDEDICSSPFLFTQEKRRMIQQSLYCNLSHVQKRRKVQFFKKILWTLWKNYLLQTLGILILLMNNSTRNILNIPLM